uniref:hypothetical protein n=1 Tax=Mycobacterium sp. TaxID=1785 RepID=UPI00261ECC58
GSMAGVDLAALWAQAVLFPDHVPPWLANIFDLNVAPELEALWNGERDDQYGCDESAIDMGLARALLKWRLSPADACQAIMCRRLRRCAGKKLDKVNPERRTTYLEVTVSKVVGSIKAEEAAERTRLAVGEKTMDAMCAPAPVVVDGVPLPEPPDEDPPEDETFVGGDDPTYNDNGVTLGAGLETAEPSSRPALRVVPPLPPTPVDHSATDDESPPRPTEAQKGIYNSLSNQMGLPGEIRVSGAEERYMDEGREVRVWLYRDESDAVFGGKWGPGQYAATEWHPKKQWTVATQVKEILQLDLNCFVTLPRGWHTDLNGLKLLYSLLREVETGTPAQVAKWGITELVVVATATGEFSTAVSTRDPWLKDKTELWMPLASIQKSIGNLGHPQPRSRPFADTLERIGCKVQGDMAVEEGHRTVTDTAQWVRIPAGLLSEDLWVNLVERSEQRDREDSSNGKRVIGPHG